MPPDAAPSTLHSSQAPPASPDVFLSYAREDRLAAERIAGALTERGWSVWWDRLLLGGQAWHGEIAHALGTARCVVVLWSSASIQSQWVLDEAGEGNARGVLVPVLLEDVEIPLGFRQVQTVNLVAHSDVALEGLVAGVARILRAPIPGPTKRTVVRRHLRSWAPPIAAAMCAGVALALYLARMSETVVDLEVKASEASFVSAREQEATDLTIVSAVDASGLSSIELPRARERPASQVTAPRSGGLAIRIAPASDGTRTGAITLPSVVLTKGAHVTIAAAGSRGFRLTLNGSTAPVGVNVRGPVLLTPAGETPELVDFGAPKPIRVAPSARGAQFDVTVTGAAKPLLTSPIEISGLSFVRIDETVETRRTAVSAVSTIVSGTLRLEALGGTPQAIGSGETLRFGESRGEITSIELGDAGLVLRFHGRVQRLESCAGGTCENRMPTYFATVAARHPEWLVTLAIAFVISLVGSRRWMRPWNLALIAALCGLTGVTGARAQQPVGADAPEEVVKQLVVRVDADSEYGSGIILGASSDSLYIATADHVVRKGRTAERITVKFYDHESTPVAATLLPDHDGTLDLAVLSVGPIKSLPIDPSVLPFDRLGNLDGLGRGDALYLLGQPNGLPWRMSASPEHLLGLRNGLSLEFESNLLAKGHSGGALLNEDRDLVGMLKSDQPPYGEAVSLYAVARKLEDWKYPVQLRLKSAQVLAGEDRTCLLTPRGESQCWGFDARFEVQSPDLHGLRLKSVSVGSHVCGITASGAAFCGGNNAHGQLGDGTTTPRYQTPAAVQGGLTFASISAGIGHSCAVTTAGDVYCWGLSSGGQLGSGTADDASRPARVPTPERFKSVSASWMYSCGLSTAGRAYCWGSIAMAEMLNQQPVTLFAPEQSFVSLAAGMQHVCGLTADGTAWCWGFNDEGQLGNGATNEAFNETATRVSGGLTFKALSAGGMHVCGITTKGDAYCWGANSAGQLGNGSEKSSDVPVRVSGNHTFETISAGVNHTCGVTTDDDVYCWGGNIMGGIAEKAKAAELEPFRVKSALANERFPWREKTR